MPADANDRDLLRAAYGGARPSAPRLAVARAAAAATGAFTVEDVARAARASGAPVATATAYRAVAAMLATGFVEQVGERDGTALYAACGAGGHHHHLVCTSCGAVLEAPCPIGSAVTAHAGRHGFRITGHDMTIYGRCARCDGAGEAPA